MRNYLKRAVGSLAAMSSFTDPAGSKRFKAINDSYITSKPDPQNALDIFQGEWSSKFPPPFSGLQAGAALLFEDARLKWFLDQIGGLQGKTILELGPLEGGHSYMLEQNGADNIVSIEANMRAYLKCLVTKEILHLKRVAFLCGDFLAYLRDPACPQFDAVVASGVLYHMVNPVELISLLTEHCRENLYIWTHYYDKDYVIKNKRQDKFTETKTSNYKGFNHHLHLYLYDRALNWDGFCGGSKPYSHWLSREDILSCLRYFGFPDIQINFEQLDHPNGPCFALFAKRQV